MKAANMLGIVVGAALAGAVHAAGGIGVNFVGLTPESQTLAADVVAGADGVAQANWNNLAVSNGDGNGHGNSGSLDAVVDGSGAAVGGVTVTVGATPSTQVWAANGSSWGFADGNLTMQSGLAHPQARITVANLPYAKYTVYAYAAAGNNGGQGSATIAVAAGAAGAVASPATYFYNFKWLEGKFVPATDTSLDAAKKSSGSNCVVFKGNTAKSFTLEWNGTLGGGWTGVSAVQIVPEP